MTTLPVNPLFQRDQDLRRCPRFETCNASLCPLGYAAGRGGVHLDGEAICPVALEFKKKNGLERLRKGARQLHSGRGEGESGVRRKVPLQVLEEIERVLPTVQEQYPEIARRTTRRKVSEATLARLRSQSQAALEKARASRTTGKTQSEGLPVGDLADMPSQAG